MKTRQLIFDKAITLIDRHGSAALSMRHLAAEIDVTPMALYRHFANREALLAAIADHYFIEMSARWQAYAAENDYEQTLALIGLDLVDFYLEHPHIYQLMFIEPRSGARDLADIAESNASPTFEIVRASIQQGIDTGGMTGGSAHEIALALAGQLHGLVALRQGGRLVMSGSEFRAYCQRTFVRAISAYTTINKSERSS